MQSIVSKGEDVRQAIQLGLNLLEVEKNQVNIEIIRNESKGLMGFGRKKAIVKLDLATNITIPSTNNPAGKNSFEDIQKMVDSLPEENMNETDRNTTETKVKKTDKVELEGKVWVSDGEIHVKDSPVRFPTITMKKGIKLFKDGMQVKENTLLVSEADSLMVQLEEEIKETKWKITTDSKKLTAVLKVTPGYKISHKLMDTAPSEHLELLIEDLQEIHNTLEYYDVMQELDRQFITYGINKNEITNAINATEESTFEIAVGKEVKQGLNGYINLKLDLNTKTVYTEDETGKINFRESIIIPTVDQGDIIGDIIPPLVGRPGMTVTNVVVSPKPVFPMIVRAEKGVFEIDNKLVAIEAGRPSILIKGQLVKASIMPKLVHDGNVNISTGNLRFYGDIEISGEVEENMVVESGSDVIVNKSVNEATISASNSIVTYGNVLSSTLTAGKNNMVIVEQGKLFEEMHPHLDNMIKVINQLTLTPAFKSSDFSHGGLQPLIRILLEKKFSEFFKLIKLYVEKSKKDKAFLDEDMVLVSNQINHYFLLLSSQIKSVKQLKELSEKMKELVESSETPISTESYLTISSALNSSLYCSGNILIIGRGSVSTKIFSGGKLKITGSLRGGKVFGELGAELNEVGTPSGTTTTIEVPADKTIQINQAFGGTIIKIGHVKHTIEETTQDIYARLNDGKITLE
ncbi:flagellar assembly protein A [Virgibacillus flavescens]|uniref:flagellar assembly protein A n=1 Tax=Virgibacillus flavescens TaxID=1611422 RepID=UPI003D33F36A